MMQESRIEQVLHRVFQYAEREGYSGYNKFDALNSPLLKKLSLDSKWLRFAFIQAIMRSPYNLRPLLGVPKSINPKGMALFAMGYLSEYKRTGTQEARERAVYCLDWLSKNAVKGAHGLGWGYNFDWQSTLFFAPRYSPNAIVSVFCGEAFIKAFETLGGKEYLHTAEMAARFLCHDLPHLHDTQDELCIGYVPFPVKSIVLNITASAGAQIAKAASLRNDTELMRDAKRMITFVVKRKTDYFAWYYTYPAENSYIVHDNYHTGGIVDALRDYEVYSGDDSFRNIYEKGLEYYARELFLPDGAPKHMNNAIYPLDIHGSAQGIISFAKAAYWKKDYLELSDRTARWAVDNLFNERDGAFHYQKGRYLTKRFTLMRWCNAWMSKALSDLLMAHRLLERCRAD